MDKMNIKNGNKSFPLTTDMLDFMQNMIILLSELARLHGNWYIIRGCTRNGDNISSGIVVCEDELIPFEGGAYKPRVKLVETKEDIIANGKTYKDARIRRKLVGTDEAGCTPWTYFKPFIEAVNQVNKGMIVQFNGTTNDIPAGWELYGAETTPPIRIIKK